MANRWLGGCGAALRRKHRVVYGAQTWRNGNGSTASDTTSDRDQALGLATYLNSQFVDRYFRQFSGHTQVNATDLRRLRYPSEASLSRLGSSIDTTLSGESADKALREYCPELTDMLEPNHAQDRIDEALSVLRELGLPREQQNERSALTLLAVLDMSPTDSWESAAAPLIGVTPIMEWVETSVTGCF